VQGRNLSYLEVLRNGRLAALLASDFATFVGAGMVIVALPLQTLRIHGPVPAALAIATVETSTYLLGVIVAFGLGLSHVRLPPRALLIADCLLRMVFVGGLGALALTGSLTLWVLAGGLLIGSALRLVGSSSRRLLATGMAGPDGLFAVNGLLGTGSNFALYIVGPVLGGVIAATVGPGVALLFDAGFSLALAVVVLVAVPARAAVSTGEDVPASGWRIMRRSWVITRLLVVVFTFNLLYMPVEVALPLLVQGPLSAGGTALGVLWSGFGVGALLGALGMDRLRRIRQRTLLLAIIGGWGASVLLLAFAPTVALAVAAFSLGGLIWAPFTPVVYSFVQSMLDADEQQPVVMVWTAGSAVAGPIGLALGGPLVNQAGPRGGLAVSALLTLALVPLAALGLTRSAGTGRGGGASQ
jgi:Transmembrane secretion effector